MEDSILQCYLRVEKVNTSETYRSGHHRQEDPFSLTIKKENNKETIYFCLVEGKSYPAIS